MDDGDRVDVSLVEDVAEFAAAAGPVIAVDPVRHTITLTAFDAVLRGGAPVERMLVARRGGRVEGVALRPPGQGFPVGAGVCSSGVGAKPVVGTS